MLLAHHVEIEILDFVHIRPQTMPEHFVFAVVAIAFVGFACFGVVMAAREIYRWWTNFRNDNSLVNQKAV